MSAISRLKDPHKCVEDSGKLKKLQDKISSCMTRLFRTPKKGGNPFLFAYAAPRPHELADTLPGLGMPFTTAATDGRTFYWNPDFLEKLHPDEVATVMMHESYHVIFFHTKRGLDLNRYIFNICVDYIVNTVIELDHKKTERTGILWGENLGDPLSFQQFLDFIDGTGDLPKKRFVFVDREIHGRSPESLYDEVMDHWKGSPRRCGACERLTKDSKGNLLPEANIEDPSCCSECGIEFDPLSTLDSHIEQAATRGEVMTDVRRAAEQMKSMRGNVPSEIEDIIGELEKPKLKFTDLIKSCMLRKAQEFGQRNNWKRFRRRWIAKDPSEYIPTKQGHAARWLALIDTSASMSDKDIAFGISQLQSIGNNSQGFVVPVDAAVHWEGLTEVCDIHDLKNVKVIGRGGTVFDDFFKEFPRRLGTEFDVIIVITDGYCGTIPMSLRPPCDVVWVVCSQYKSFKPSFGRVAPLRYQKP